MGKVRLHNKDLRKVIQCCKDAGVRNFTIETNNDDQAVIEINKGNKVETIILNGRKK